MSKFEEMYSKIATTSNYVKPTYPRMDNWSMDIYKSGDYTAAMSDGGYSRFINKRDANGKVMWRVNDYYPAPLEFQNITSEEFESIVF